MSEHHHKHLKHKNHGIEQEQAHDEIPDTTVKHKGFYWVIIIFMIFSLVLLFAYYSLPKLFR